jgi:hypothetical protein
MELGESRDIGGSRLADLEGVERLASRIQASKILSLGRNLQPGREPPYSKDDPLHTCDTDCKLGGRMPAETAPVAVQKAALGCAIQT